MLAMLCLLEPIAPAYSASACATRMAVAKQDQSHVRVSLNKTSFVLLRVFDPLGNLIYESHNGKLSAGVHDLSLNIGGLRPGVYFYRLQVDDKVETKKLLIH